MHPLNDKYFGNYSDSLRVFWRSGGILRQGYIVKQTGTRRFVVSDGLIATQITLATDPAQIAALPETVGTIIVRIFNPALGAFEEQNIVSIWSKLVTTVQGNTYPWDIFDETIVDVDQIDESGSVYVPPAIITEDGSYALADEDGNILIWG